MKILEKSPFCAHSTLIELGIYLMFAKIIRWKVIVGYNGGIKLIPWIYWSVLLASLKIEKEGI